jgi:GH24 family phage-related lysozyme (muramidase)
VKITESGIALLKRFEGLELDAYQDIAGVWTIGYGHTGPDVQPNMRISENEAEALLRRDLKPRENAIDRLVKIPLNQNEFDALVSFVYNVGADAFRRSTALKRLNRGERLGAADALTWFNKATVGGVLREVLGLTRRRAAEKALFVMPTEPPIVREPERLDENSRITPIEDTPRRGNVAESRTIQGAAVAGGAGVAASTLGRDNAEELDQIETNIEDGTGLTEDPSAGEGSTPPNSLLGDDDTAVHVDENGDVTINGGENDQQGEMITGAPDRPSKHEVHAAEEQIQFALFILIVLAALFVIYARVDDWRQYRR